MLRGGRTALANGFRCDRFGGQALVVERKPKSSKLQLSHRSFGRYPFFLSVCIGRFIRADRLYRKGKKPEVSEHRAEWHRRNPVREEAAAGPVDRPPHGPSY